MKNSLFLLIGALFVLLLFSSIETYGAQDSRAAAKGPAKWKLRFTENFNGDKLNTKIFSRISVGESDWNRHMSDRADLVVVKNGEINILGVKNDNLSADSRSVLTGGITTQGKFNIKYGKIEIRAKMGANQGAWPAIWMMPENPPVRWPACGEIDIIERKNLDPFVFHTVHTEWTQNHKTTPPHSKTANVKADEWNVYAFEWTPDRLTWRINGKVTHSYSKIADDEIQWPFNKPFYLMIDMQLGGHWTGPTEESTLPITMSVDWIKFYDLYTGTKQVSEFSRPK